MDKSIITDFLDATGINLPKEQLILPNRKNESISALGLELLRRLNRNQSMFVEDGTKNEVRRGVPQLFQQVFGNGAKFRLPPELANSYHLAYSVSNEWVRKEYFPESETLFPVVSQDSSISYNLDDYELDQLSDLLNSLLLAKATAATEFRLSGKGMFSYARRKIRRVFF